MNSTQQSQTSNTLNAKMKQLENKFLTLQTKIKSLQLKCVEENKSTEKKLILINETLYLKDINNNIYNVKEPNIKIGLYIRNRILYCEMNQELEAENYI